LLNYEPITNNTPRHEPSPSSLSGPSRLYLAVSSSSLSSSSTITVFVCHRRHHHHHGVGCCLVPHTPTFILILVVQRRRNPTNDRIDAASPSFSSPPRRRRALSALSIAHGAILDRHAASTPSGTTQRVPLPPVPPFLKNGTIAPEPPSWPPRCLSLLYGFSGRRHQSGDGNGSTLALTLVPGASGATTTMPDLPRISIVFVADLYSFVPKA
jgi:hypothetical protein